MVDVQVVESTEASTEIEVKSRRYGWWGDLEFGRLGQRVPQASRRVREGI